MFKFTAFSALFSLRPQYHQRFEIFVRKGFVIEKWTKDKKFNQHLSQADRTNKVCYIAPSPSPTPLGAMGKVSGVRFAGNLNSK